MFLVVDDLGAGYSNLMYIVDLYPEVVKLDRKLVTDLHRKPRQQMLVRHIVALCDGLGARVVAEGIETALSVVLACPECGCYGWTRLQGLARRRKGHRSGYGHKANAALAAGRRPIG